MKKQHTLPIGGPDIWKAIALLLTFLASGCTTSRLSREVRRMIPHPVNPAIDSLPLTQRAAFSSLSPLRFCQKNPL
jgi:hypothetical protein